MKTVYFFRGLNTFGTDDLRIGPFNLGPYCKHFITDLSPYKIVPVLNMKFGKHSEVSARATNYIQSTPEWSNSDEIHFLAHSTGGLIARQTLHNLGQGSKKVSSLLTLATPHFGALAAQKAIDLNTNNKLTYLICKFLNYDTTQRVDAYKELTKEGVTKFNEQFLNLDSVKYTSMAFNPSNKDLHLLLNFLKRKVNSDPDFISDGIVEYDSQVWGDLLGSYPLDHLSQLGFHYFINKKKKSQAQLNYQSMISNIKNFWHTL